MSMNPQAPAFVRSDMKKTLLGTAILLLVLGLLGYQRSAPDNRYYFLSGMWGDLDLFVNGNPTNRGHALTYFLVDGKNSLELKGDVSEYGFHLTVFRAKGLFDPKTEIIIDQRQELGQARNPGVIEFEAEMNHRWMWRKADTLGPLTVDDRAAILAIFDSICAQIQADNFDPGSILKRQDVVLWSCAREHLPLMEQQLKELQSKVPPRSELVFQSARHEELRLLSGKQLAMLVCDHDKLVYLGPPAKDDPPAPGEVRWTYSYGFSEMFSAKFDGQWKFLIPNL
jgi:hypothetical protein